jgi:hypothetical protein
LFLSEKIFINDYVTSAAWYVKEMSPSFPKFRKGDSHCSDAQNMHKNILLMTK